MSKLCESCRYFSRGEDTRDVVGQCRFHAPKPGHASKVGARDNARIFGEWPWVFGDDWCGEYKARKESDPSTPAAQSA